MAGCRSDNGKHAFRYAIASGSDACYRIPKGMRPSCLLGTSHFFGQAEAQAITPYLKARLYGWLQYLMPLASWAVCVRNTLAPPILIGYCLSTSDFSDGALKISERC